ncbi:ATP-binding protein [Leucobacter sp. HY1910]
MNRPPLVRPRQESLLAGVCAGLAAHLGVSLTTVRAIMVGLALCGGFGVLLYAWFWVTVPAAASESPPPMKRALTPSAAVVAGDVAPASPLSSETTGPARPAQRAATVRRRWPVAELLLGVSLLIAGLGLVLDRAGVSINLELVLPALAVLVGVGLAWWQIADRGHPDRHVLPRVLGALTLVAVGVLMFFVTARQPSAWTVIAAALAVLTGVALALAPWALRLNRELIAERAANAREAERADIAAHLHDSVLQTLALIQQRSAPSSEVARLARRQERELREWLFRGADGGTAAPRESAETELRTHAAALEATFAAQFEVITVGETVIAPEPLIAAAREAMLNAARHAGGSVTVYLETTRERISIDVTDRGPGVDVGALPEGRMGVRESILGRIERASGTASIRPGPGGAGTTVRLSVARDPAHTTHDSEEHA